jgi:hypothetical protein
MAYIGKAPNTAIVNQTTSQSFNGTGSATAFTLNRSVNVGEDLEVFVNNVQQEPGSGKSYTASGTTLTFDEAPPSGTGNVYVIYRGEATINPRLEHDANAALSATTGTFTGNLTVDTNTLFVDASANEVGIGTTTPATYTDYVSGSNAPSLVIAGSQPSLVIADTDISGNDGTLGITKGGENTTINNIGNGGIKIYNNGAKRMEISSDGEITKPTQPAFLAKPSSQQQNITGDTNVTVVMDSEIFDVGSNFASNTFTAPVTGKYFLSFSLYGVSLPGSASYMEIAITTSNRGYVTIQEPSGSEDVYAGGTVACLADMDANDTAFARVTIGGSSTQFDIGTTSRFSGALIC